MPDEPVQFDMNGEVVQPRRSPVADLLARETIRRSTTTPWADLARDMAGGRFATDMGTTAGPCPVISDMAFIGGDLHVRFVGSRRWEPVRHMSRAEAGLPSYMAGDTYATPWNRPDHPLRVAPADTAYERYRLRRAELAAALGALNPTDQPPIPTRERLNPEWIETPLPTTPAPPIVPLNRARGGRTAEERARDAAAAERRRDERRSDPPHDEPNPAAETEIAAPYPPMTWADVVTPTEPPF